MTSLKKNLKKKIPNLIWYDAQDRQKREQLKKFRLNQQREWEADREIKDYDNDNYTV